MRVAAGQPADADHAGAGLQADVQWRQLVDRQHRIADLQRAPGEVHLLARAWHVGDRQVHGRAGERAVRQSADEPPGERRQSRRGEHRHVLHRRRRHRHPSPFGLGQSASLVRCRRSLRDRQRSSAAAPPARRRGRRGGRRWPRPASAPSPPAATSAARGGRRASGAARRRTPRRRRRSPSYRRPLDRDDVGERQTGHGEAAVAGDPAVPRHPRRPTRRCAPRRPRRRRASAAAGRCRRGPACGGWSR